jgi:hypothetical protein
LSEAETKVVVGKCIEIVDKPDTEWVKFNIDVGTQYPLGLSTKKAALIEQARAVGSEVATWTYLQSDGNPNPNKPGTFYQNRWLNKVERGGSATAGSAAAAPSSGAPPQQTALPIESTGEPVDWDAKERRSYRSKSWAITVSAFTHTIKPDEDPIEVFKRLLPFQMRLYNDVVRELGNADEENDLPF